MMPLFDATELTDEITRVPVSTPTAVAPLPLPAAPALFEATELAAPGPESALFTVDEVAPTAQLDAVRNRSIDELVADKDFSPVNLLQQTKDFASTDPALIAKITEVYRQKETQGTSAVDKAKAIVTGVPVVAKALGKGVASAAEKALTLNPVALLARALGAASTGIPGAVQAEGKRALGEAAEVPLSVEAAVTGSSDLLRRSARVVKDIAGIEKGKKAELTPEQWRARLFDDVAGADQAVKAGQGNAAVASAIGISGDELAESGIKINPETVQELSAITDPVNFIPIGGAIGVIGKFAGKVTPKIIGVALNAAQAAKAAALLNAARDAVAAGAGRATQAVGAAVEKTGELVGAGVRKVTGGNILASGGLGAILGASIPQVLGGITAAKFTAPVLEAAGRAVTATGKVLTGEVAAPAALAVTGRALTEATKGVAEGALLAVPFELGARPEEEQAILGGAGLAGAIRGAGPVAAAAGRGAQNALAARIFRVVEQQAAPESATYGTEPNLDAIHQTANAALDSRSQKLVDWTRELFRDSGVEVYTLDDQNFKREVPGANARGFKVTIGETVDTAGNAKPLVRIMLNADAEAVPHEIFHALTEVDPTAAQSLIDTVSKDMTKEQRDSFEQYYNSLLNDGRPESAWTRHLGSDKVAEEVAAEIFSRTYLGQDLSGVTPSASQKAALFLSSVLEKVGAPLGQLGGTKGAPGVSSLGIRPTARQARVSQNYLTGLLGRLQEDGTLTPVRKSEILADLTPADLTQAATTAAAVTPSQIAPVAPVTRAPATPIAAPIAPRAPGVRPTPGSVEPRNIRVTREQQNDFAQRRAEDTGIEPARTAASKESPETQDRVQEISTFLEQGNPVLEIVHRGVEAESGTARPAGRTERRAEQEAAYIAEGLGAAPETIRDTYQKTTVPVRWEVVGGKAQLISMSLDKVIANISRLVKDVVTAKAESLFPYTLREGKLTPAAWSQVIDDVQSYTANQANGFRGDGQPLVRPTEDIGVSIPAENPAYNPVQIPEDRTNAINVLMGLATPLTAREGQSKSIPGNVKGQILAELQGRTPTTPANIRVQDLGKQTFKSGRTVQEVNPLRNELVSAGVPVRELLDVTERINARDVQSVTARPDLNFRAPVTDIIRAGFLPGIETDRALRAGFLPDSRPAVPSGSKEIRDIATNYARANGVDYKPSRVYAPINVDLAKRLADYYEHAKSDPSNPEVAAAYTALADQTAKQYQAIVDAGYTLEPFQGQGEPYKNSAEAVADMRDNKHLYFLKTESAGDLAAGNPLLSPSGVEVVGQPLLYNDLFRAVHDFFGHGKEGYQFGPRGEFNAWRAHSEMFTPEAQGALAAETLAQNSWVNYGQHLRDEAGNIPAKGEPGYVPVTERPFAEQKNIVIPADLIDEATTAARKSEESFLPKTQQEVLDNLTSRARMSDPRLDARLIPMEEFNRIQAERKAAATPPIGATVDEQFLPASSIPDDVDPIVRAAIRTPKGRIFEGSWHGEAAMKIAEEIGNGTLGETVPRSALAMASDEPTAFEFGTDGFVTRSGKFLNREEAFTHAERINQLREGNKMPGTNAASGVLESHEFARARDFQPKEFTAKDLERLEKYNVKKTEVKKNTGWILPNSEFVPLDTNFHEQYLAEHADDLNKKFSTAFSKTSSTEERLQALNQGFVRFRYDQGSGSLVIEANASKWGNVKRAALNKVLDSISSVDKVRISLLNNEGQVVDSSSARLFDAERPEDAVQTAFSELRPNGRREFLPKVKPTAEQVQNQRDTEVKAFRKDIRDNFPEAIIPEFTPDENGKVRISPSGQPLWKSVPYRFEESFVAQAAAEGITDPKARQEAAANAMADNMVKHAAEALKDPAIEAGKDWYNLARTKIGKMFGADAGFFTELLGATSAQTPVPENFKQSIDAYNLFKAGKYDDIIAKYREGKQRWDEGAIEDFVADTGNDKPKRNQYLAWWIDKNNLKPKRSNDKLFNANSLPVLRVLDRSWKPETQGPKTPNFADNLSGASDRATIDVWAARAIARAGNEGNPNRWRLVNFSEGGVTDKDFFFGQDVFEKAAQKLGMKAHELQALLWFAEKDRWGKNGWTSKVGEEKSDFNFFLDRTKRGESGQLEIEAVQKKPAKKVDSGIKADELTKK